MTLQAYNPDQLLLEQYRSAIVVGLGLTGFSVVRYLRARGVEVAVIDSRAEPPYAEQLATAYPEIKLLVGKLDHPALSQTALLVVSPGVALAEPALKNAKQNGAHIVGDIELFIQENTQPLIAVTGSNGKSTVTTLVARMCEAGGYKTLAAGNIGVPALDALTDQLAYQIVVLELSSFQLETTTQIPAEAAAVLNVSADHMDRYQSMGDYLLAKARILRGAKQAVLPRHDEQLQQITNLSDVISFGLDEPSNDTEFGLVRSSKHRWLTKGTQHLIKLSDITLVGLHNVKNVLSALALVDFLKIPTEDLVVAVKSFSGLPHRMQTVHVQADVTWVNDSKATNIGATSTALSNLEKNVYWIAGGQGKGADFTELRSAIDSHIKLLVLFGEDADQIEAALTGLLPIERVSDMRAAVTLAAQSATTNSVVLFSPACASFDMYQDYQQRGEDFASCVQELAKRGSV